MNKQLLQVIEFHKKFKVGIGKKSRLIDSKISLFRYKIMREEVEEYLEAVGKDDLSDIAKELCDVLYATYGTIIEHGLQDKLEEIFDEVHLSNMSKDYSPTKMIKGENYKEADVQQFFS